MRESATFFEILFNIFLWGSLYLTLKPVLNIPYRLTIRKVYVAYLILLLFCLFPFFGGDYFHYINIFDEVKLGYYAHVEEFYLWLIKYCNSYHLFRFCVWGLALFLTIKSFKRLDINYHLALFFFGVIYLPWFSYARASLAMASIFYGLSFIARPIDKRKFISLLVGFSFLFLSIIFHKTAVLGIVCALCSMFLKKANRKIIIILFIFFPIIVYILSFLINQFMNVDLGYDDFITGRQRDNYLTNATKTGLSMGVGPFIMVFFSRAPLFIVAFSYIYLVYKGYYKTFSDSVKIVSSYAFVLILLAIMFSLDLGYNTYVLYYRTLNFAHIPSAVFLAYIYSQKCIPRLFKFCYYSSLFGVIYTLIYSAYCTLI